ncbi:MAG: sulfatase [Pirellulales bacterium]|nr:sulfatase [Pirellulales bacterium]
MATLQNAEAAERLSKSRSEILALSLGLAALLIAVKFVLLPFPVETVGQFARWALRLALVAAPDICFVAGTCVAALAGNRMLARFPAAHTTARLLGYAVFYVLGIFGVASVGIYKWTMAPLSWQGLQMAGGVETFSSSLAAYVDLITVSVLLSAPAIVILLPFVVRRFSTLRRKNRPTHQRWRPTVLHAGTRSLRALRRIMPRGRRCALAAITGIALYGFVSHSYIQANWIDPNRWERRIAQSPHAVFLQSVLTDLVWGTALPLDDEQADLSDFAAAKPGSSTYAPKDERPKNVLIIMLESTAAEYTSLTRASEFGPAARVQRPTTPRLAEAAAQSGIIFDNCYVQAPSSCKSLASLMASVYPRTDWWLLVRDNPRFAVPTIAEQLTERGFRMCFAHSGTWSWKQRDAFLAARGGQTLLDASSIPAEKVNSWGISDRDMFDAVLDWIDHAPQRPFFALAYTIETHHPYVVRSAEIDFGVEDPNFNRYLNALHETDRQIGRMLDELRRRGLLDDTLIAITADHGESFGQHNQRIHSFAVYDAAVHVPLVLLHPSLVDHQRRDDRMAGHVDLAPTILDMLSITSPPDWQGQSLFADRARQRNYFFCTGNEIILGLREGAFKYHYYVDSGYEELFDLSQDPGETANLANHVSVGKTYRDKMADYRRRLAGLVRHQQAFWSTRLGQ